MSFPPLAKPSPKLPESLLGERLRATLPEWLKRAETSEQKTSQSCAQEPAETSEQKTTTSQSCAQEPAETSEQKTTTSQSCAQEPAETSEQKTSQSSGQEPRLTSAQDSTSEQETGQSSAQEPKQTSEQETSQSSAKEPRQTSAPEPTSQSSGQDCEQKTWPPPDPCAKAGCNRTVGLSLGVLDSVSEVRGQRSQNPAR